MNDIQLYHMPTGITSPPVGFEYCLLAVGGPRHTRLVRSSPNGRRGFDAPDCHLSLSWYPHAAVEHTYEHKRQHGYKSMANYHGPTLPRKLPWDCDAHRSDTPLSLAQQNTRTLYTRLTDLGVPSDAILLSFSGGRGFHVELPPDLVGPIEASEHMPKFMGRFASRFLDGLVTGDRQIYRPQGLFRVLNTRHPSGAFKVRLTPDELFGLDVRAIVDLATAPRYLPGPPRRYEPVPALVKLWAEVVAEPIGERTTCDPVPVDPGNRASARVILEHACAEAEDGTRNAIGLKLACQLRDNGYTRDEAESLMRQYARAVRLVGTPPYTIQEALDSMHSAYSYTPPGRGPWSVARSGWSPSLAASAHSSKAPALHVLAVRDDGPLTDDDERWIGKAMDTARGPVPGRRFTDLYVGRWRQAGYNRWHDAVLDLLRVARWWTSDDPHAMDRWVRWSGLMVPELWDATDATCGATFGQVAIARAIAEPHAIRRKKAKR